MDPGWLILFLFMLLEGFLVTLLILPVPSNNIRGKITNFVASLWERTEIQYLVIFMLAINLLYFYFVFDALLHPLYDFGILSPVEQGVSCEVKAGMYRNERNAYISGMSLFFFFVLNRLVDIQGKLHVSRKELKASESVRVEKKTD